MGLCIDQAVCKIKEALRGRSDGKELVARAERELVEEDRESSNRAREAAFDGQAMYLVARGYPEAAGMDKDQFMRYLSPLRDMFQEGDVIVVPERFVSVPKQMSMTALDGKPGYMYEHLNLGSLRNADGVTTPNVPYLIRDVENGSAMRGTSPDDCVTQFREQGRYGLTTEESIAVITHSPEILRDHYMDLPGSRYAGHVPSLWLRDGRPELRFSWDDLAAQRRGSASCGSRLGPGSYDPRASRPSAIGFGRKLCR